MSYNEKPTVITLQPDSSARVVSFEEAFGEHSNAGGKQRRQAKKQARQVRKNTKTQAKIDRKQSRVDKRIENRNKRGSLLGNILTGGVSGMTKRAKNKRAGKVLAAQNAVQAHQEQVQQGGGYEGGDNQGADTFDPIKLQNAGFVDNGDGTWSNPETGEIYDTATGELYANPEPPYQAPQPQYQQPQPQYQPQYQEEEEWPTVQEEEEEEEGEIGDEEEEEWPEYEYGVDGGIDDGNFYENADGASKPKPAAAKSCMPAVMAFTDKIVWNKELLRRLTLENNALKKSLKTGRGINAANSTQVRAKIAENDKLIIATNVRLDELNKQFKSYIKSNKIAQSQVDTCTALSIQKLQDVKKGVTPIDPALDATITPNQIVIEPESSFDGTGIPKTGLKGVDDKDDFDAPPATVVEIQSNAEGKNPVNYKAIAIGVGVAAVAILVLNKFIFKK